MIADKVTIVLAFIFLPFFSRSQERDTSVTHNRMNEVTVGVLGSGNVISLNYGRKFLPGRKTFFVGSIGIGIVPNWFNIFESSTDDDIIYGFSHSVTFNYGGKGHFVEFGGGANLFYSNEEHKTYYVPFPVVGYRFQTRGGRKTQFVGRLFFHPRKPPDYGLFIPAGIALGINF